MNNNAIEDNGPNIKLTAKEKKLLELIQNTRYGEIRVAVKDGQPVLVEEVKKFTKL